MPWTCGEDEEVNERSLDGVEALVPEQTAVLPYSAQQTKGPILLALIGIALLYVLGVEQGSLLQGLVDSSLVHEFLHDARHIAAFPCH